MSFVVNVKQGPNGLLVIVTDKKNLGKKYEEERLQLDFTKTFYQGEEKVYDEVKELMLNAQYLHLSGENSVALGLKLNLVNKKRVILVKNVPHAEAVIES